MTRFISILFLSFFLVSGASANSPQEAVERMKARLPQIDEMKELGEIGENAAGYLSPRKDLNPRKASIVESENNDRRTVYMSVASKTGQTVKDVGANRAVRIAELARKGVWLQLPNGDWYRKE